MINTALEPFLGKGTAREVSGAVQAIGGAKSFLNNWNSAQTAGQKLSSIMGIMSMFGGNNETNE